MSCNCNSDTLRIPSGNDFRLGICRYNVVPGSEEEVTFENITDLVVKFVSKMGVRTTMDYTFTENGDLIIEVPESAVRTTTYGIEMTGTYNDHKWRWKTKKAVQIVDSNDDSSVQGLETFADEIYWLDDELEAEVLTEDTGETLCLYTHGEAYIDDGVVTIINPNAKLSDNNELLTITNE